MEDGSRPPPSWQVYFFIFQALLWFFHVSVSGLPPSPFLICQPSQERGPLASKVIELLGGGDRPEFSV